MATWLRWATLSVLIACSLVSAGARASDADRRPFVPSFWNPDAVPAKPDLSGIDTIRFVTTDDFPPFGFALDNGAPAGFDVDLARTLCTELQVRCTVQARPWADILPALSRGDADAAIGSIAITGSARRTFAFTQPYFRIPARFAVTTASRPEGDPADWRGTRVGVVSGTAQEAFLLRFFPHLSALGLPTADAARAALKSGAVDAVFADGVSLSLWLNGTDAAGCCTFAGGPYTEEAYFGKGAGIALRKGDAVLRQALDFALARAAADGHYGDIYLRYFPLGLY